MFFRKKVNVPAIDSAPSLVTAVEKTYQSGKASLVERSRGGVIDDYDVRFDYRSLYGLNPDDLDELIRLLVRVRGAVKIANAQANAAANPAPDAAPADTSTETGGQQ